MRLGTRLSVISVLQQKEIRLSSGHTQELFMIIYEIFMTMRSFSEIIFKIISETLELGI